MTPAILALSLLLGDTPYQVELPFRDAAEMEEAAAALRAARVPARNLFLLPETAVERPSWLPKVGDPVFPLTP